MKRTDLTHAHSTQNHELVISDGHRPIDASSWLVGLSGHVI